MLRKFKPNKYYENVYKVNFKKLYQEGIRVVACDLDNTLVPHDVELCDDNVLALAKGAKEAGLKFVIVSNNHKSRVEKFVGEHNIEYYYGAKKPLPFIFKKIIKRYRIKKNQLALIGDQIMTDIFGANSFGITSILVTPLAKRDIVYTKINRIFEKLIIKRLEKKKMFKIGEYYE